GKGYLLPAPLMPRESWRTLVLPTPMAVSQTDLPIAALIYDPHGREVLRHPLGRLPRAHATVLDLDEIDDLGLLGGGYGHIELVYDFSGGGEGDGWLHALFRYRHRQSGHAAETSFGAHVFNTVLTYRDEPQSYTGRPPGLSTRLFLRLGEPAYDTFCHLIYPASRPWLPASYAARANLRPILLTGLQPGGQLTITTDVENYPGFAEVIQGPWLMEQMQQQAEHVGTKVILDMVTEIDLARRPFVARGDSGDF